MRQILSIFLLFFIFNSLKSQEQGTLRVFTQPKDAIIYLDTLKLQYNTPIKLDTGKYTIKAWAPERELVEKEFYLKKGMYRSLPVKLPYSKEYKKYSWEKRYYSFKKKGLKYGIILAYLYYAYSSYSEITDLEKQSDYYAQEVSIFKSKYETSVWPIDINENKRHFNSNKEAYDEKVEEINERWRNIQIGAGVAGVLTYFTWKVASRIKKPIYEESPKLTRLQMTPVLTPMSSSFQLNYQF